MSHSEAMMTIGDHWSVQVWASSHADGALNTFIFDRIVERGLPIIGLRVLRIFQLVLQGLFIGRLLPCRLIYRWSGLPIKDWGVSKREMLCNLSRGHKHRLITSGDFLA